jgi:hypothetical protein
MDEPAPWQVPGLLHLTLTALCWAMVLGEL